MHTDIYSGNFLSGLAPHCGSRAYSGSHVHSIGKSRVADSVLELSVHVP